MQFVGVDGCKKGWFAVSLGSGRNWAIDVYKTIDVLWKAVKPLSMMFIDIPWLQNTRMAQSRVRESHPELCFWALAGKHSMAHTKKTVQGFTERYSILKKIYPQSSAIVKQALNEFRRKELARDDILDALVLAVSALFSAGKPKTVPLKPPVDKKGLAMEIVYPFEAKNGGR